jgi:hypothetical protein
MTIEQITARNRETGHHFFDADTLRFFRSRINARVYHAHATGVAYFVTSEQAPHSPRRYTLRRFDQATGEVETVGEFLQYATRSAAHNAAFAFSNERSR